jgi:hypothetical protein
VIKNEQRWWEDRYEYPVIPTIRVQIYAWIASTSSNTSATTFFGLRALGTAGIFDTLGTFGALGVTLVGRPRLIVSPDAILAALTANLA